MVVLVTGCSSGFGLHTAVAAAKAGHVVYAGLRDLGTRADLDAAYAGGKLIPVQLDITQPDEREAVVARIVSEQGRIDALVNNAGVALGGFLETVDEDELRRVFEVNVFGTWALTRAVLPAMRAQRKGVIVNVSSMSGRMAFPALGPYSSSKFALEGLSETWRHELRPLGIRVLVVQPGAYRTQIFGRNRHISRNAHQDPYGPAFSKLDALFERIVDRQARPPQYVADEIVRRLEAPGRRFRHPLGSDAWLRVILFRYAPFRLIEGLVDRVFGHGERLQ